MKQSTKESSRRYYLKHKEEVKQRAREYYYKNKERVLEKRKADYMSNPKPLIEKALKYRDENRERFNINERKRYHKNIEKQRDRSRKKYEKYKERFKATNDIWRAKNLVLWNSYSHKRRLKIRNAKTDITKDWILELANNTKVCPLCNTVMDEKGSRYPDGKTLDHIIPINVGGTHTRDNVRFICKKCNSARPKDGRDILKLNHSNNENHTTGNSRPQGTFR